MDELNLCKFDLDLSIDIKNSFLSLIRDPPKSEQIYLGKGP